MSDRLREAQRYSAMGLHPIPFHPHSKTPAFAAGDILRYRTHKPTSAELRAMFAASERNIGLITGAGHLVVLDVDGDAGQQSLRRLPALPDTPTVRTSRGFHAYFYAEDPLPTRTNALPGLDILGRDWQILAPSSTHPDRQHTYTWAPGKTLTDLERARVPDWVPLLLEDTTPTDLPSSVLTTPTLARPRRVHAPTAKSRYLSSGAPVLLDTNPHVSPCNARDVRMLYGDADANRWAAAFLGLPRLRSKFLCLFHAERRPSMSLYVDSRSGAWKVHDWHGRGEHAHYGLADIFASRLIGHEIRLEGNPTLTVWWLRLLITSGYVSPADVPAKPLPPTIKPSIRTLYDGFILNFQGRWLYEAGKPMPYTEAFAMGWCGLHSKRQVAEGLYWLRRHGYMRAVGRERGSQVYLPGEGH